MSESKTDILWAITGQHSLRIHAVRRGAGKSVCGATPNPRGGWITNVPDEDVPKKAFRRCADCVRRLSPNQ